MQDKPILVIQAAKGPDYLADLTSHYLYGQSKTIIKTNKHPDYLFEDFPPDIKLYGKGFTAYRKLGSDERSKVKIETQKEIARNIKNHNYKRIIWTSIRREASFLEEAISADYSHDELFVLDGEDDQKLTMLKELRTWERCTYFKRELNMRSSNTPNFVQPISFKFPEKTLELIKQQQKCRILATCDPRFTASYIFPNEHEYLRAYSESLFAFTTQKAGWDCLRHYEILACNCLPVFPDIDSLPSQTMVEWDRGLQREINNLWICFSNIINRDISHYLNIWEQLAEKAQALFRGSMTTRHYNFLTE